VPPVPPEPFSVLPPAPPAPMVKTNPSPGWAIRTAPCQLPALPPRPGALMAPLPPAPPPPPPIKMISAYSAQVGVTRVVLEVISMSKGTLRHSSTQEFPSGITTAWTSKSPTRRSFTARQPCNESSPICKGIRSHRHEIDSASLGSVRQVTDNLDVGRGRATTAHRSCRTPFTIREVPRTCNHWQFWLIVAPYYLSSICIAMHVRFNSVYGDIV